MKEINNTVAICKEVLNRLSKMGYETKVNESSERLIYPKKIKAKVTNVVDRISEQELRFLFVEEFKIAKPDLYYSIETPTNKKYFFGKSYDDITAITNGQSASLDMCIFERDSNVYNRILNIEFKHKNTSIKNIGKDVLKLLHEDQNGAFIHLLNNTRNKKTLWNVGGTGVFHKLYNSFYKFQSDWNNENKTIQLIIFSLEEETLIYREIRKSDLNNLKTIFFIDEGCGKIRDIKENGWKNIPRS